MKYVCPVCGSQNLNEVPYDKDNNPSDEICRCCGFQFGYDEDIENENGELVEISEAHQLYRVKWIKDGAILFSPESYPKEAQHNNRLKEAYLIKQLNTINVDYFKIK